ncbi:MAG: SGNH/GDSL hydrolase family protein [Chitinophagales bacterium]|nr:SGNH/GDSL hydrolase family protein [Chitinophagales bacterium]
MKILSQYKLVKFLLHLFLLVFPFVFFYFLIKKGTYVSQFINLSIPIYLILFVQFIYRLRFLSVSIKSKLTYFLKIYFSIELILVLIQPNSIYDPMMFNGYLLPLDKNHAANYYLRKPFDKYDIKKEEFMYSRNHNSVGLTDKEYMTPKPEHILRILCMGDSFTEGDGAHQDSSYVRFLDRSLQKKYKNIELINAGRLGSDPFFDFDFLKKTLIKYQPDIILQSFSYNDLFSDFIMRGGKERFDKEGNLKKSYDFWWTPIYVFSYTARVFIQVLGDYDKFLVKKGIYPDLLEKMKFESVELFKEYHQYAKDRDIGLIIFDIPFSQHYYTPEINKVYIEMAEKFSKAHLKYYSLKPCYDEYMITHKAKFQDYYWPKDSHHNAKGYSMMAHSLEKIVTPFVIKKEDSIYDVER